MSDEQDETISEKPRPITEIFELLSQTVNRKPGCSIFAQFHGRAHTQKFPPRRPSEAFEPLIGAIRTNPVAALLAETVLKQMAQEPHMQPARTDWA